LADERGDIAMKTQHFSAIIIILLMGLSTYYTAGASAQSAAGNNLPLTIYHLGTNGQLQASQSNVFNSGESISISFPDSSSPPYSASAYSAAGQEVWTQQGSFKNGDSLTIQLSPYSFPPNANYGLILRVNSVTLPGMAVVETYAASFRVVPGIGRLSLESYSSKGGSVEAHVSLTDMNGNHRSGIHLGLFLQQDGASIPLTTEVTDAQGKAVFRFGQSLAGGHYSLVSSVLDTGAISASPLSVAEFSVDPKPTTISASSDGGKIVATLQDADSANPVVGRLVLLEQQLKDGNWTIVTTGYTDDNGQVSFPSLTSPWRASFRGDAFYAAAYSDRPVTAPTPLSGGSSPALTSSTFVGNTFSNGHITMRIEPSAVTIYDPSGQTVVGQTSWEAQVMNGNSWQSLSWDGPLSMTMDDIAGLHRVILQGTANQQLAVTMYFLAKSHDAPFTPLQMPVQIQAIGSSHVYRLVWHVDTVSTTLQLEQRTGDQRTPVSAQLTVGASLAQSPSGENSMVALAPDGTTVLLGANWDGALQYYQGTDVKVSESGSSTSVKFGPFALASGQSTILPACPCPDGGGGGGGSLTTTTTLYLPSSVYATIPTVLNALVKDQNNNAVVSGAVNFYRDGSLLGQTFTNSTGFASLAWTPGVYGSHVINATFIGNCCWSPSTTKQTLSISQTPTTTMILKPTPIVYSWDLYNYYGGNGRPIVVPIITLTLAATNSTNLTTGYIPAYNGSSTAPAHVSGFGWVGLNQTSVTVTFNSTYTQTQAMNWTRNFYLPPCPNPPSCTTTPRSGHMYLSASLSPPSTLYSTSSTNLNVPYSNINSVSTNPLSAPAPDGSTQAECSHTTVACSALLTTTSPNDIIVVFTSEALDLETSCTFGVFDSAGLTWAARSPVVYGRYQYTGFVTTYRDQLQEWWSKSPLALTSDNITETISGCNEPVYGGEYNGLQVFAIKGANYASPFDPNRGAPGTGSDPVYGQQSTTIAPLSTSDPNDFVFAGIQGPPSPVAQSGFTLLISAGGSGIEYGYPTGPLTNYPVTFTHSTATWWEMVSDAIRPAIDQANQNASPPAHLYVQVNATYPYISIQLESMPVALEAYVAWLAYSLGPPTASTVNCNKTTCFNYYTLPFASPTQGSDFAYVCSTSACTSPAANTIVNLYNSKGTLCISTATDFHGIAQLNFAGPKGCTYPYYYLGTQNTQITVSELFAVEAVSNPYPFYTNFQGYNYAIYAPQRTGRYLLSMHGYYQSSSFTVFDTPNSFPDVQQIVLSCCDVFLNVEKHPVQISVGLRPGMATIVDNVNATIILRDQAEGMAMPNTSLSYSLKRSDPSPATVSSGTITTNSRGNYTLTLGKLSYGNYTLTVSWAGNSTSNAASFTANFTVWRSRTIIIISPGWIQQAFVGNTYLFTTMLIDNATQSFIAVSGLQEQIYVNGQLTSTLLCTTTGCSTAYYYLTNPGGNATFPWTPTSPGLYILNATFPQQNYYPRATFQIEVSAARKPVMLIAINSPAQPNTSDNVTWTVHAYDMMNNASVNGLTVTQYINGVAHAPTSTNATGFYFFTYQFPANGYYNITFYSTQNTQYTSAITQQTLKIFIQTTVTLTGGTVYLGQQNSFSIHLQDTNNNNLAGRIVQVYVDKAFYQNVTTDSSGNGQFTWGPTTLGSHSISVQFAATGSQDSTYRASSSTLTANVVVQKISVTDTTSGGTQSISLPTASGSTSGLEPSISLSFPSLTSISITASFLGSTVTATVGAHITLNWACAATVNVIFVGTVCLLWYPVIKTYVDFTLAGVLDLHIISQVLGSMSISQSLLGTVKSDLDAFGDGIQASGILGAAVALVLTATIDPEIAGAAADGGMAIAAAVGSIPYHWKTQQYVSYLYGLMIPPLYGLVCAGLGYCHPDTPAWLTGPGSPVPDIFGSSAIWAFYELIGVVGPAKAFGDFWPALELGIAIAIPAVLIAMQGPV
jgi:hypothetical protein